MVPRVGHWTGGNVICIIHVTSIGYVNFITFTFNRFWIESWDVLNILYAKPLFARPKICSYSQAKKWTFTIINSNLKSTIVGWSYGSTWNGNFYTTCVFEASPAFRNFRTHYETVTMPFLPFNTKHNRWPGWAIDSCNRCPLAYAINIRMQ